MRGFADVSTFELLRNNDYSNLGYDYCERCLEDDDDQDCEDCLGMFGDEIRARKGRARKQKDIRPNELWKLRPYMGPVRPIPYGRNRDEYATRLDARGSEYDVKLRSSNTPSVNDDIKTNTKKRRKFSRYFPR